MIRQITIIALFVAFVYTMPAGGDGIVGGRSVPHPNSKAGQELTNAGTQEPVIGGRSVPHPNSEAGKALSEKPIGGGVPHPNSAKGKELSNQDLHVLEGGSQVKPWLKQHPNPQ